MKNKEFLYFPSFSVGNVANAMMKRQVLRNGLPMAFYSNEFPKEFRHTQYLTSAGHYYKKMNHIDDFGFSEVPDMQLLGDSGGYQICTGAIKWSPDLLPNIFQWLEANSHIAMNLDIPPRMKYAGKFNEALEISVKNFKYFHENQSGRTKFINVLQGGDEIKFQKWYDAVKGFEFRGWGIGGCQGSIYKMMTAVKTLLHAKEHYNANTEYLHILGTSRVIDFFILSQLQKSLNEMGSNVQVTTDSSTPSRTVTFGLFYHDVNFKNTTFGSIHVPKERADNNKDFGSLAGSNMQGSTALLPNLIPFDSLLEGGYTYEDLRDWTIECYATIVLHNFMFFKDTMHKINSYVGGHPYFLEQVTNSDTFLLLRAVDEMVKAYENGTTPQKVYDKYKSHFIKMSSQLDVGKTVIKHEFFK